MHLGMGYCIPGNPYVPVEAETAAQLANNPFVDPAVYWDIAKWQKVLAVLQTSTPTPTPETEATTRRRRTTTPEPATEKTTLPPPTLPPTVAPTTQSTVEAPRCGGQSFVYVSTTSGSITSPGYDRALPYPSQDSCFWQIEAPLGYNGVR